MLKKILITILIASLTAITFTGCWDRKELNEVGIVLAIGIDKDEKSGGYLLSSQIIRPEALSKNSSGREAPFETVITSGETLFQAIRNTVKEFDRRSIFSHVTVILVSEELARQGLDDITDFISRSQELRKSTWLMITSGAKAYEVINIEHGLAKVQAGYMEGIIKKQKINSYATTTTVIDFIKKMPGEGIHPVAGVFKTIKTDKITPEKNLESSEGLMLSGTAVFNKSKLVGFLDEDETFGLNMITGNKKRALINLPTPKDKQEVLSIEITKIKSKFSPSVKNNRYSFKIDVEVEGNLTEIKDGIDVSNPDEFEKLNEKLSQLLLTKINSSIKKIQGDFRTDVIGFGSAIQRKHPKDWKKIKDKWDTVFPDVSYSIHVKSSLKGTGLLIKSIDVVKKKE